MADVTLAPCCQKAFKQIQACVELSKNAEKFPDVVKYFGKAAKGPTKLPMKFYADMTKAVAGGGIKIFKARAIKTIATEECGQQSHTADQAEFWGNMAGM